MSKEWPDEKGSGSKTEDERGDKKPTDGREFKPGTPR